MHANPDSCPNPIDKAIARYIIPAVPWCPKCGTEYRDGFTTCYDCNSPLVESLDDDYDGEVTALAGDLTAEEIEEILQSGVAAYEDDEFEDALECFNEVIRANPDNHEAYNMLGLTFAALNYHREAWRSFKHALRTDETDTCTFFYIADFLCDQGDYELAKEFAERHLEIEEDEEEVTAMQEVYNRINARIEAGDRGAFIADMTLELESLTSNCLECKARLPMDAPYCPVCGAIHIYPEETADISGIEDDEGDWDDEEESEDIEEPELDDEGDDDSNDKF